MWLLFILITNAFCCTLKSNDINIRSFYQNNVHRKNIHYVQNGTDIVITPCLFTPDENITIILEDQQDSIFILSLILKHLSQMTQI